MNILQRKQFEKIALKDKALRTTKIKAKIKAYGGEVINITEACILKVISPCDGQIYNVESMIMDTDSPAILGLEAMEKMGLITKNINSVRNE